MIEDLKGTWFRGWSKGFFLLSFWIRSGISVGPDVALKFSFCWFLIPIRFLCVWKWRWFSRVRLREECPALIDAVVLLWMGAKRARTNFHFLETGVPRLRMITRRRRTPNGTFLGQQSFPNIITSAYAPCSLKVVVLYDRPHTVSLHKMKVLVMLRLTRTSISRGQSEVQLTASCGWSRSGFQFFLSCRRFSNLNVTWNLVCFS